MLVLVNIVFPKRLRCFFFIAIAFFNAIFDSHAGPTNALEFIKRMFLWLSVSASGTVPSSKMTILLICSATVHSGANAAVIRFGFDLKGGVRSPVAIIIEDDDVCCCACSLGALSGGLTNGISKVLFTAAYFSAEALSCLSNYS